MTATTFPAAPPSGTEILIAWLTPLGAAGGERQPGDPLPFWMVTRVAGGDDKITDHGTFSVHSMAETLAAAEDHAMLAHQRILGLGPPLAAQQRVTISGGRVVMVDGVRADHGPFYEYYSDTIRRFVARYDIDLRFIAA